MNRIESWVYAVVIAILILACGYFIVSLVDTAAKVSIAVIGVAGVIVAAVVKHGFDLERERRQAEYIAKQKNYTELLATIGNFARNKEGAYDALCSAHIASWAFGDKGVILATNAFLANPSIEVLTRLLREIRLSLEDKDGTCKLLDASNPVAEPGSAPAYKTTVLFSPRTGSGLQ